MKRALVVWMLVFMGGAASGMEPLYEWERGVQLPATGELFSLTLDAHMFRVTQDNLADFRLRTADGAQVSYLLHHADFVQDRVGERRTVARLEDVSLNEDGLQFEVSWSETESRPARLHFLTALRDFEQRVELESSADGLQWVPLPDPALIYDYSSYIDARQLDVPLPPGTDRFLRVTIRKLISEQESRLLQITRQFDSRQETSRSETTTVERRPFRISQVELIREFRLAGQRELLWREWETHQVQVQQDLERKTTLVEFDTSREPITQLELLTSAKNFHRAVQLEGEVPGNTGNHWQGIANQNLSHLEIGDLKQDGRWLSLPESRCRRYRLVLQNADSAPLPIEGVRTRGPILQAILNAPAGQRLTASYGAAEATRPNYDTQALTQALKQGIKTTAASWEDPVRVATTPVPAGPKWQPWSDPVIVSLVLVLLAGLLGVSLYRASQAIALGPENTNSDATGNEQ